MRNESIKTRRAKLLVEGFLEELNPPRFAKVEDQMLGFSFVIGFEKNDGGLKLSAVEIKQTEKPIVERYHFMGGRQFTQVRKSNLPTLVFVADTKLNELYYGFASKAIVVNAAQRAGFFEVSLPVKKTSSSAKDRERFLKDFLTDV